MQLPFLSCALQVQQLLHKMQLPVISDAVEALIQARPSAAAAVVTAAPSTSGHNSSSGATVEGGGGRGVERSRGGRGGVERGGGGKWEGEGKKADDEFDDRKSLSLNRSALSVKWSKQLSLRRSELLHDLLAQKCSPSTSAKEASCTGFNGEDVSLLERCPHLTECVMHHALHNCLHS